MSFMNSGAECSTSRNPLSQFTKHSAEDRSLQHERVGQPGAPQNMSMRSHARPMNAEDQQMMDQFAAQQAGPAGPAFSFESMHQEMNNMGGPQPQQPMMNNWAADFKAAPQGMAPQDAQWAAEFGQNSRHQSPGPAAAAAAPANPITTGGPQQRMMASRFAPQPAGMFMSPSPAFSQMQQQPQQQSSQIKELDAKHWEDQFKQMEEQAKKEEAETKQEADTVSETVVDGDEEFHVEYSKENFENVWEKIKNEVLAPTDADFDLKEAWDRDFDEFTHNRPEFGDYQFEENNPYTEQEDPYTIGVSLMDTGAKLSVAALCFEAAVQRSPEHVEAWARLGACQAQNEKEDPAIRALEKCIKLDPNNLGALMNLSVSYTNEGCENAAYATLEKWIAMKYPHIVDKARTQEPKLDNEDRFELHSRVTELFIRAAQLSPDGANMDADVQVGLGVLFYGNEEYEKAIDCFNAALTVRPNDPLLWNRLGATLANSSRSEEAIDAYYKALELRPAFVRARYNLGVSCINIGCYKEAAQHLLSALSLHNTDDRPAGVPEDSENDILANQSTNLYETLRRVFLAMERRDLVEKVGTGMDVNEFRNEFDF